jgi:hypothetical protein
MLPTLHYLFFPYMYVQDGDKGVKKSQDGSRYATNSSLSVLSLYVRARWK